MPKAVQIDPDNTEKATHYNSRTIEAIEFIRELDFALGSVFKYVWRDGLKDATTVERKKRNYYIRDALVHRPVTIGVHHADMLIRKLSFICDQFETEDFELLVAVLTAATGDYSLLAEQAKKNELFSTAETKFLLKV
tara:strand:- start:239 stop:649 length:411 start_codon:yes stop_codon:yes gene_type:complete